MAGSRVPQEDISREMRQFLDEISRNVKRGNFAATAAPAVGDDADDGWVIGSLWIDTSADTVYMCCDATKGAAVWKQLG